MDFHIHFGGLEMKIGFDHDHDIDLDLINELDLGHHLYISFVADLEYNFIQSSEVRIQCMASSVEFLGGPPLELGLSVSFCVSGHLT